MKRKTGYRPLKWVKWTKAKVSHGVVTAAKYTIGYLLVSVLGEFNDDRAEESATDCALAGRLPVQDF